MRWIKEYKPQPPIPRDGDKRLTGAFLWTPRTIANQTRWLEWALIEETAEIRELRLPPHGICTRTVLMWVETAFID